MILQLDSIMESKRKSRSDNEANKSCKVVTLDEITKIIDNMRGNMCAEATVVTFR
jgi:hypothetical protein